jgi:hypothetical protein
MNSVIQNLHIICLMLLLGLSTLVKAQKVETPAKNTSIKPAEIELIAINQPEPNQNTNTAAELQNPLGGVIFAFEFVIEDDIMQSVDENTNATGSSNPGGKTLVSILSDNDNNQNISAGNITNAISKAIKVFPIPSDTYLNIDLGDIHIKSIEIVNSIGQIIFSENAVLPFLRLDTSAYQAGTYFLRINTIDNQVLVKNIMIH